MELFDKIDQSVFEKQQFAFLQITVRDHVLYLTLDRAEKKNALHPQMINEIAYVFQYAHHNKDIWIVVIQAKGNVFCAGADLKAMAGFITPNDSTIPAPKGEVLIANLFRKIHKPTIAKVTGDVYAGGFIFLAGANIVIAQEDLKFGLPEVKKGLFPFQVMAVLLDIMPSRKVLDWCIRGYNLPVKEAQRFGLVTQVTLSEEIDQTITELVESLKQNSPKAIQKGLEAFDKIRPSEETHKYLMKMLLETIASKDGQEGLQAFREKRKPNWSGQ